MERCPNCQEEFNGAVCFNCGYRQQPKPSLGCAIALALSSLPLAGMGYCFFLVGALADNRGTRGEAVPFWVIAALLGVACISALVIAWNRLSK